LGWGVLPEDVDHITLPQWRSLQAAQIRGQQRQQRAIESAWTPEALEAMGVKVQRIPRTN